MSGAREEVAQVYVTSAAGENLKRLIGFTKVENPQDSLLDPAQRAVQVLQQLGECVAEAVIFCFDFVQAQVRRVGAEKLARF